MRINNQSRICFRWSDNNAHDSEMQKVGEFVGKRNKPTPNLQDDSYSSIT